MRESAVPVIRTKRLVLRGLRAGDFPRFAAMMGNPEVTRFLGDGKPRTPPEAWRDLAASAGHWVLLGYGRFAIADAGDSLIGHAGLFHPPDWPELELGYIFDRPAWGHGFAQEAVAAIRDWAFATHRPDRLVSFIAPANTASRNLAARLGAVQEGAVELRGRLAERWVHPRPGCGVVA